MNEVATTIIAGIGALGGLSATIASFLYLKENKLRKQAETKSIEIDSLTDTIKLLQDDKKQMHIDMKLMREEIDTLKKSLRVSDAEKIGIETDLNTYKRAFGCRVECESDKCPIETKLDVLTLKKEAVNG